MISNPHIWLAAHGIVSVECPSCAVGACHAEPQPLPTARLVGKVDWGRITAMALLVYIGFALVMDFVALVVMR